MAEAEQQKRKLEALAEDVRRLDGRIDRLYERMGNYVVRDDM